MAAMSAWSVFGSPTPHAAGAAGAAKGDGLALDGDGAVVIGGGVGPRLAAMGAAPAGAARAGEAP